jgi:histidyl-tRNA synthetase
MFEFLKKTEKERKLSTEPYKGVRDFFPADMAVEKKIFSIWRNVAEKYGYEEYNASVLEPADLYRNKTSEEIVNEQTYTFTDRGDREVTLRPEITPTLTRMVAAKRRELVFPVRWYSIPNLFRYEQPQRGRIREFWQLNVDLFGVESINAEVEVITMAYEITRAYGLKDADFEIRLNNRKVMNYVTRDVFGLSDTAARKVSKLIDKKDKIPQEKFSEGIKEIFEDEKLGPKVQTFLTLLNSQNFEEFASHLPASTEENEGVAEIREVIAGLEALGVVNVRFDQTLMRGFDYYTGIVFEVFDLNPANRRAVFGGGRYDELLSLFGNDKIPAVGFGAGDVAAQNLMETYGTWPSEPAPADISILTFNDNSAAYALDLAQKLREKGLNSAPMRVSVDLSGKKIGDKIKNADKRKIPQIIVVGDEEIKTGKVKVKTLATGEEVEVKAL